MAMDVNYNAEYDQYMADVTQGNALRRGLSVTRPRLDHPSLSPEAETRRQAKAVDRANASQDDTVDSGYTITDGGDSSSSDYSISDPKGNVSDLGGVSKPTHLRQGSASDQYVKPSFRDATRNDSKPEDYQRLGVKPPDDSPTLGDRIEANPAFKAIGAGIKGALDTYESYIAGPTRRAMFKEDPLETLSRQTPGPDASYGDIAWHATKTLGTGLLADPLTAIGGLGFLRAGRKPGGFLPPTEGVPPSPTPVDPLTPIQDLRAAVQGQHLAAASVPPPAPSGVSPLVRPFDVGLTDSGSLVRHGEGLSADPYTDSGLTMTPTGSLVRRKPELLKAQSGYTTTEPLLPSLRSTVPGEPPIPESRLLHGRSQQPEGPPKPIGPSAEDLLLAKQAAQQRRFEKLQQGVEVPVEVDIPGTTMNRLDQPVQAGPRSESLDPLTLPQHSQQQLPQTRFLSKPLTVLREMGQRTRRIADIVDGIDDYSELGTKQNFLDGQALVEKHFGSAGPLRKLSNRVTAYHETGQIGDLLNSSILDYGITPQQSKAIVELLNAGLDPSKVSKVAQEKYPVKDPRVQAFAQEFWQVATGRASSNPFVQNMAMVTDPITGEKFPVGEPGPFWPHQAVTEKAHDALSSTQLKRAYERGQYADKGIDYDTFKERYDQWLSASSSEIRLRKFAGIEYKQMLDIGFDAQSHKRTVVESLEKYGYETDPLRMLIRYNLGALKRAASLEHTAELKTLMKDLAAEYGEESPSYKYIREVVDRSQGISRREDFIEKANNPWHIMQSVMYPALLKGSWKQNLLLQPNYVMMETGVRPLAVAVWKYIGAKVGYSDAKTLEMAERSGANFPGLLARYTQPGGLWEQYAKTMASTNLFAPSDNLSRNISAMAYAEHTQKIAREFYKDPANPKWRGILQERHLNPDEVYKDMSVVPPEQWVGKVPLLPDKHMLRAMQAGANGSMGRTGVRGLPLWASGDSELHHMMLMLKRQILSNETQAVDMIMRAPTPAEGVKRALRLFLGAGATGYVYNGAVNTLLGKDFEDTSQATQKFFKGDKTKSLIATSLAMGLGTFSAGIIMTGMQAAGGNYVGAGAYTFMSPAMAKVFDELVNKALKGDAAGVAAKLQPSEIGDNIYRRYQTEQMKRKQSSGLGMGTPAL